MATLANWNGHTFVVSPGLVRGFTDFTVKGSCETTVKNSDKQKYEERKYGESPDFGMTVHLNALTGVTDVYGEAMAYVTEATQGACDYFYLGTGKLIPAKAILKSAEVSEVVFMPAQGDRWVSCDVKLTFRQGSKSDGSGGGSGSGGSKKASVKTSGLTKPDVEIPKSKEAASKLKEKQKAISKGLNYCNNLITSAQAGSSAKTEKTGTSIWSGLLNKATTTASNSAAKTGATTGRNCEVTTKKITRVTNISVAANVR